jgi:hypothetical protein
MKNKLPQDQPGINSKFISMDEQQGNTTPPSNQIVYNNLQKPVNVSSIVKNEVSRREIPSNLESLIRRQVFGE